MGRPTYCLTDALASSLTMVSLNASLDLIDEKPMKMPTGRPITIAAKRMPIGIRNFLRLGKKGSFSAGMASGSVMDGPF